MGAGKPDYQKLHEMGKLPENMKHMIPGLVETEALQAQVKRVMDMLCDDCRDRIENMLREDPLTDKEHKRVTTKKKDADGDEPDGEKGQNY